MRLPHGWKVKVEFFAEMKVMIYKLKSPFCISTAEHVLFAQPHEMFRVLPSSKQ